MLLFCEECGEKYVFEDDDPSIEGTEFECRTCGEMIRVPAGRPWTPRPVSRTNKKHPVPKPETGCKQCLNQPITSR